MQTYDVIATRWLTNARIGVVAIRTRAGNWKAYVGYQSGPSEREDAQAIAGEGHKLTEAEARAFFAHLDVDGLGWGRYEP